MCPLNSLLKRLEPARRKIDHLRVCSTDIHCLSLRTCSRMVSFYKMFVFRHLFKVRVTVM